MEQCGGKDEIVVFKPLSKPQVRDVAAILLRDVTQRLAAQGITIPRDPLFLFRP